MSVEYRARTAALRYVAATKHILHAYYTATALMKMAAAIYAPTQNRLRLKTRRVLSWRMLKRGIWRMRGWRCRQKSWRAYEHDEDGILFLII